MEYKWWQDNAQLIRDILNELKIDSVSINVGWEPDYYQSALDRGLALFPRVVTPNPEKF